MPEKLNGEYLDMYKGTQSEVISTNRFDENSDFCKTCLGKEDITRLKWKKGFLYQSKDIW